MTIEITRPEIEALVARRLESGAFRDAEDLIYQALKSAGPLKPVNDIERSAAIGRLRTFGETHGLSLGGTTLRELRDEALP